MNKLDTTGSKNVNVLGAEELEQVVGGWGRRGGHGRWGGSRSWGGGGGGGNRRAGGGGGGGDQRRNGGGGGGITIINFGTINVIDDRDQNDDNVVEITNFGDNA